MTRLIRDLEKEFGPHRYGRVDSHYPLEKRGALMEFLQNNPPAKLLSSPVAQVKSADGVKFPWPRIPPGSCYAGWNGANITIYAEAKSDDGVKRLLARGVALTKQV